jgi:uncharacterized repeat protein (TIGR01451 family)
MLSSVRTTACRSRYGLVLLLSCMMIVSGIPRPTLAADSPFQIVEISDGGRQVKEQPLDKRPSSAGIRPRGLRYAPSVPLGQGYATEVEPNGTTATATPLVGTNLVARANLFPNGDIDFFSFTANAGDRVYAATMTSFSPSSQNSQITVIASDGITTIEFDDDNGTLGGTSSSVAGATLPTAGTYFLKVNDFTAGTTSERPYELHVRIQSGAPTPEVEPNDTPGTATPLPGSGWVSGTRDPALATEQDWYSMTLNAGDTVYLALDLDPERDATAWNGRLGIALFGDATNQILVVDDAGTVDTIPSEATFFTVKSAGTYFAFVDSASAAVGGPTATYHLSVSVHPATDEGLNCTTYASTDVPKTIGPGTGLVSSVITVPGNPRIADMDVAIELNHTLMGDIDAHLRSPAGNDNGLFTDIGAAAAGGQTLMDVIFDDEAGIPPLYTVLRGPQYKPEVAYRLGWFDGENAGGTWTLDLRDDGANVNGGTLTAWSLRICEAPPPPMCPPGSSPVTVFSTDFEAGAAGFTHSGTADEWELGLPATVATTTANPVAEFSNCNSGTSCWKTDLDNTYEISSNQDLLSPNINLAGLTAPVVVTWAQRYQMESASFDHFSVDYQQAGGATPVRLFEWLDGTMTNAPGNPTVNIGESSGWSIRSGRADSLAGLNTELRFHLDTDTSINFGGVAIDDVTVTACQGSSADLSITKTNGQATTAPGLQTTYTIVASNAGPSGAPGATVADTLPAAITAASWTCVGAGGGTCTASGSGNINDNVNLPAGGSVTYTLTALVDAGATGTLSNTATVVPPGGVTDPVPGNNSATDTDTLAPEANLSASKTDGQTTTQAGAPISYTIVVVSPGPSHVTGATVTDAVPALITGATWTCVGSNGGTCTASGSGDINDTVNLPSGSAVIYTLTGTVSVAATGTLSNTATVTAPPGVLDAFPGDNSSTDTDTIVGMRYFTLTPCRVVDTRGGAPIGGPVMQGQETRTFAMAGNCGIPSTAKAIAINVTVNQPTAAGNITAFEAGQPLPPTSTINYVAGQTRANNAVMSLNASGEMAVFVAQPTGTTVHVIIDVSGYFQ